MRPAAFIGNLWILLFCVLSPSLAGAEDWKLSSSADFDTGNYGTGQRTSTVYVPFTLKRYYTYSTLSVTLPYIRQSSRGLVTWVGGRPARISGASVKTAKGSYASGIGDILAKGTYALETEGQDSFYLALAGTLKLPTADKTMGLGTGEMDEGAGVEFSKDMRRGWTLLADWSLTIIGSPPGQSYSNQVAFDFGFSRKAGRDLWFTMLYETSSALVRGNPDPRDISGMLDYASVAGNHYFGRFLLGLSDGSPDLGISVGVSRRL